MPEFNVLRRIKREYGFERLRLEALINTQMSPDTIRFGTKSRFSTKAST